jgi:transposase
VPWERRRLTLIGALGLSGVVAMMTVAAATSAAVFLAFIEGVLAPALKQRPEAVVVLDNLSAHKTPAVRGARDRAGISYRYLPSYSPDFNPIEPCWAKLTLLLARLQPDRTLLGQAEGPFSRLRRAHLRGPRSGTAVSAEDDHSRGRSRLVPALQVPSSLKRKPL